jgi:NAD(P)H-flavin reductase
MARLANSYQLAPDPMLPQRFVVERSWRETADTFTVKLEPVDKTPELAFAPGQFNMLYVFGVGEIPISISGDPADNTAILHTTRAVGTVTKAMSRLKPGDMLGLRGPFGSNWPVLEAVGHDIVLVTGGIGLAPLRQDGI